MLLFATFFSDHFAEPYVSKLQLWVQDFGLVVSAVMAFVMAEALMMLILAVILSAVLWIYICARAAGAALLAPARHSHYRAGLKPHELR
jgi:hypothetical protein